MTTLKTIVRDLIDHADRLDATPRTTLFKPDPDNLRGTIMRSAAARFVAMADQLSIAQQEKLAFALYRAGFDVMCAAGEEGEEQYRALTPHEIAAREVFDSRMLRRLSAALDE